MLNVVKLNIVGITIILPSKILQQQYFSPLYTDFTMHSIISIVGVVLSGKENYHEWSQKIQHTFIFNELWKGVCVGEGDETLVQPTSNKELTVCENKNRKAYALIVTSVSEEVS